MKEIITNLSIGVAIVLLVMFLSYAIGLSQVFKELGQPRWRAFVPMLGFATLLRALHLPGRWFFMAFIPYVGAIYSAAAAQRLGKAYNKKLPFALIWLTYGCSIGMPMIGFSKIKPDLSVVDEPTPNLKELEKAIKKYQRDKKLSKKNTKKG